MSEQLKFIVQELNKEPFNKSFNLISFDSLEPLQLLQVLNDVLGVIDPKQAIDIREETPDMTAIRIFGCLRVLKYKPPTEDVSTFRTGLVQGDKPIIYHILEWMLKNIPGLQKRAYLAKFLVKVEVPADIRQDEQMVDLYQQYDELIETFKELHKQSENLKNSGYNTGEIRKDISNMEDEKEQLIKRVERLKRKVEQHPNANTMMNVAKNLRLERDKEKKLAEQRQEQLTLIQHSEQKMKRLQQQLHDHRQASVGATAEGLLQRLEEESRANSYIVKERLPKDIESKKKSVADLQRVVAEPAMGQADLEELHNKIQDLNTEINQLVEKRMRSGEPMDDKLSLFRQQKMNSVNKSVKPKCQILEKSKPELAISVPVTIQEEAGVHETVTDEACAEEPSQIHHDVPVPPATPTISECRPETSEILTAEPASPSVFTFRSARNVPSNASLQSFMIQALKKMTDMERAVVGVSKRVSDLSAHITRVESKLDGFISRQSSAVNLEKSTVLPNDQSSVPQSEFLSDELVKTMFLESKGSGHFACKLIEVIFPELFGPENLRFRYNWNGTHGKQELDPSKKEVVRRYMGFFFPDTQTTTAWSMLANRINERLRRPATKMTSKQTPAINQAYLPDLEDACNFSMTEYLESDNLEPSFNTYRLL